MDRRSFLVQQLYLFVWACLPTRLWAEAMAGNFSAIYRDPQWRDQFLLFLKNVYNIYPHVKFHELISEVSQKHVSDQEIYRELLKRITEIKPFLSEVTYAIPALKEQKREMARQFVELLPDLRQIDGYIEIGSPGRYVESINERLPLKGRTILVHDHKPGFSPVDILERGGLMRVGEFVPLNNYAEWALPEKSSDLISCFIGLHHSPPERLDGFVKSIWKTLRPGGRFILRDHDANSEKMTHLVALAHDVFNAGLGLPWEKNVQEIRHFKSLEHINTYLAERGFERQGPTLFQKDDPTKNALMMFKRKA